MPRDWAILGYPSEPRVLLLPGAAGWSLPAAEHSTRHFWQDVAPVNAALGALLGLKVTTLRCARTDYQNNLYVLESHSPNWSPPPGAIWAGQAELGALEFERPELRAALEEWFAWDAGATSNRPPWYRPGWFTRAAEWMLEQLERHNMPATGPIEQLRSWERSAILRAPTAGGLAYFKAVPAMFAHEPALTQALAARDPARFPAVLAADVSRRWMLMPDAGGTTLDQVPDLARWESALRAYARVQIALAPAVDELARAGCPHRPLAALPAALDALLADTAAFTPPGAALSAEEIDILRGRAPEYKAWCAELARLAIPPTLEHGDFWAGQVVLRGEEFVFIDWSDSTIAHPFFSMSFFADTAEAEEFLPGVPGLRERLRDAYLEPWAAFAPRASLLAAFELAQSVSALHNAAIYHQWILPRMEAKWEMRNMIPFYLRKLLKR
jgi:hypothetical protein